jgi:hypothetical protein
MYFDSLLREIINSTNSQVEAITLENFEDMSEDDLRSLVLIGNGRVRHAYRPESLYSQYVARRGRNLTDPLNPSYQLTGEDLEKVFSEMRKKYADFEPEDFSSLPPPSPIPSLKRLTDDDEPHRLLSQRNTYLDNLDREFNEMINRRYVRDKRPIEYDKGKGPGGFPMRNGGSCGNYGMPAKEPKFEDHLIWLHDPDRRYNTDNILAYTYGFVPNNTNLFSPGNTKPGQIQSQKMPDWMTTDPSRRDKVTFIDQITPKEKKHKPIEYYYEEPIQRYYPEEPPKKENRKVWLIIAFILFVFLLKKRR